MSPLPAGSNEALSPTRAALAAAARVQIEARRRAAEAEADEVLDAANHERVRMLEAAETAGASQAIAEAALRSARARRTADEEVLAQREAIRTELAERVRITAMSMTADPRYPKLLEQLTARARDVLGPRVEVTVRPEGGVMATAGTRTLDLTLPALAARQLAAMNTELESLWTL
ncbi:MAG TPA: hypothetical protein VIG28_05255 [Leifsonia sp.]|jgi:vacuolar-type H+-ATPase subunit E/Vma4